MGEILKKVVEEGTEAAYVPLGSKCDICGKKLGFFATGFWSCNTKHVKDGNLCGPCNEKLMRLIGEKKQWMTKSMQKSSPLAAYTAATWRSMSVLEAKQLIALKEQLDQGVLDQYGENATALMRVREAFQLELELADVGIFRWKQLHGKMVVYGQVEEGAFAKGDIVRIDSDGEMLEVKVNEAYADDGVNTFERHVRANMGKQRLAEDQIGWLLLDLEWGVFPGNAIVK